MEKDEQQLCFTAGQENSLHLWHKWFHLCSSMCAPFLKRPSLLGPAQTTQSHPNSCDYRVGRIFVMCFDYQNISKSIRNHGVVCVVFTREIGKKNLCENRKIKYQCHGNSSFFQNESHFWNFMRVTVFEAPEKINLSHFKSPLIVRALLSFLLHFGNSLMCNIDWISDLK